MDLRHIENAVLERAILHVVDAAGDTPLYAAEEIDISDPEINYYIVNHIVNALTDEAACRASYIGQTAMIARMNMLMDEATFIEGSRQLALRMFEYINAQRQEACDLLVVAFRSEKTRAVGLLKLDFRRAFIHELSYREDGFKISLVAQDIALPTDKQKVSQAAFAMPYQQDAPYHLIVLDKAKGDRDTRGQFLKTYLNAERQFDYKDKTKTLRSVVEKWTQKNLKDDFAVAEKLRNTMYDTLRTRALISANSLIEEGLDYSAEAQLSLGNRLAQQGVAVDDKFEIDKRYVNKKLKTKTVSTDTGFTIKGDFELFDDEGFIEIRRNGDGTVDYLIKGVRHVKER